MRLLLNKTLSYLVVAFFGTVLLSCSTTTKRLTSDRSKSEINSLLVLPPFTLIEVIYKGNNRQTSIPHSKAAAIEIRKQVLTVIPETVAKAYYRSDSSQYEKVTSALSSVIGQVEKSKTIKGTIIPEVLFRIMDSSNQKFALGIWEEGFIRTNDNYALQSDQRAAARLFFGSLVRVPNKSGTVLVCFIIDKEKKNLAFYEKLIVPNRDPTNKFDTRASLRALIMSYFDGAK